MSVEMDLKIPGELQDELDDLFPVSEKRRKIASILMFWDRKPTTKEQTKIGEAVGRKRTTVNEVILELTKQGYFSPDLGSMPLWRYTNQKAGLSLKSTREEPLSPVEEPKGPLAPSDEPIEVVPDESVNETGKGEGPPDGFVGPVPGVGKKFDDRLTAQEQELKGIRRTMDTKFEELTELITKDRTHALSVAPVEEEHEGNPSANPSDNPGPTQQHMEESTVEPIGALLPGLSRDQLIEIATNQPGQIRALMGLPPRSDEGIESLPITTRVVAVELNTYTLSVFERVVHDGYDGSMSDFLNDAAYKYFEDRGKRLDWVDTKRGRRRLP